MLVAKGISSRSGPPKDPAALRRDRDAGEWVRLPAEGRQGDPPEWPLASPSGRELDLWREHWALPHAVMWEKHRLEFEVALYVRNLAMAEVPGSPANRGTLVKQLMEDLGLTEAGRKRNAWAIEDSEDEQAVARPRRQSAKSKLKVVHDAESA